MTEGMGFRTPRAIRRPCMSITSFTAATKRAVAGVGAAAAAATAALQSGPCSSSDRPMARSTVAWSPARAASSRWRVYSRSTSRACVRIGSGTRSVRSQAVPMAFASSMTSPLRSS